MKRYDMPQATVVSFEYDYVMATGFYTSPTSTSVTTGAVTTDPDNSGSGGTIIVP
ncbi:MAG: hypothetical protein LUH07_04375 [Lachnospiraceae bacterium]|nr:hypothetical protein [Lachnospiraceae bacterium]